MGLDTASGDVVWKVQRTVPGLSVHGDSSPLISGDAVVTGLSNGKLMANSVINGRDFWETDLSFGGGTNELERLSDIDSQPVLVGSNLFAATYQGDVVSLDLPSSSISWRQELSTRLPLAVGGDQLYVTDTNGGVAALRTDTGEKIWSQEALQGRGISNPIAMGNRVLVGDSEGNVHLLDAGDGSLLQIRKVAKGAIVSLVATSSGLIAFSARGALVSMTIDQG
jgi:outer membrane protein assembly factor BamB